MVDYSKYEALKIDKADRVATVMLNRPDSLNAVNPVMHRELCTIWLDLAVDDEERLGELFAREGDRIAAVIIEPVPANNGLLLQRPAFLASTFRFGMEYGSLLELRLEWWTN